MEWLGRKLYPRARPFERRSRMQMLYLVVTLVVLTSAAVAAALWYLNNPTFR